MLKFLPERLNMKKHTITAIVLLAVVLTIGITAVILKKVNSDIPQTERPEVTSTGGIPSATPDNAEKCTPSTSTETASIMTHTAEITATVIPTNTGTLIGVTRYPTMAPTTAPTAKPTEVPPKDLEDIDFSKKTITLSAMNNKYKTQGRCPVKTFTHPTTGKKETAVLLNYSASAFSVKAYCEGTVTMELYTPSLWNKDGLYFNVLVDGVKISARGNYKLTKGTLHTFTLATGLEKGLHTFTIERQSEATLGAVYVHCVTLNGEIAAPPANGDYFIEFIGDSLISGYGILYPNASEGEYSSRQDSSVYQDATKAFAYLAAKKLNADYSIVAETGIGIVSSYGSRTMSNTYSMTCAQCYDETTWSFSKKADAVVLTLGTNDNVEVDKGKITYAQMEDGFKSFLLQIRTKNPSAKIVWAYGAMGNGAKDCILSVLKELGGEANGYYYVGLEYNGDGGVGHPSVAANSKNAETLAQALKKIL